MTTLALQRTNTRNLTKEELEALIQQNRDVYTEFYDEDYINSLIDNMFPFINDYYFRAELVGFEDYPERSNPDVPLIFASNHSGMAFPWDALLFGGTMHHALRDKGISSIRPLVAPMLSETNLMNPYMLPDFWKRAGGIDATTLNFETTMYFNKADVLIYPEGVPGIGKGFNRRYQLQRFSTSFIRMSLKHKTDVIPVYSINGEFINPYSYRSKIINKISSAIGIPYIPLGILTLFIPFFPWIFYFGMPANFRFVRGARIKPYDLLGEDKAFEEVSMEELRNITNKVHDMMQKELDEKVALYGKKPYNFKDLFKRQFSNLNLFWNYIPPAWPLMFAEHERQYKRYKKDGTPIKIQTGFFAIFIWMFNNPLYIFYIIPIIGWIPLIIKGYSDIKKPK